MLRVKSSSILALTSPTVEFDSPTKSPKSIGMASTESAAFVC